MSEIYFSVDVEADGPFPEDVSGYSMSSFGAVATAVKHNDGSLTLLDIDDPANQFYTELKPISEKFVPEAAAVSGLNREDLWKSGVAPRTAISRFVQFADKLSIEHSASPVFVAWPAPFDWFWVYWYLMKYNNGNSPFGFSGAVNMKDVYSVKAGIPFKKVGKRNVYKALGVKARPHTHNALDDALEQAELWNAILTWEPRNA